MTPVLDAPTVLRELHEVATKRQAVTGHDFLYRRPCSMIHTMPDGFTYTASLCAYTHNEGTETGCIIGEWLHTVHGVPLDLLREHNYVAVGKLLEYLPVALTDDAAELARKVQNEQDNGIPWVAAVAVAAYDVGFNMEEAVACAV